MTIQFSTWFVAGVDFALHGPKTKRTVYWQVTYCDNVIYYSNGELVTNFLDFIYQSSKYKLNKKGWL